MGGCSHIYMTIRSELVQSFDEKLKLAALTCLTSITKTVSKGVTVGSKQDTLKTFVEPLLSKAAHLAFLSSKGPTPLSTTLCTDLELV